MDGVNESMSRTRVRPEPATGAKRIFTTGEAAAICKVSQQTIIRCFDAGRLMGFRVPGSKFRRIPREELRRFMRASGIPTEALDAPGPSSVRVLIVDDDPSFLRLAERAFAREGGFEIRTAQTGYDAGALTESFRPDVIVLDLLLPDLNGGAVCARVRARDDLNTCLIVGVTASEDPGEVGVMESAGPDLMLRKPIEGAEIVRQVRALMGASRA